MQLVSLCDLVIGLIPHPAVYAGPFLAPGLSRDYFLTWWVVKTCLYLQCLKHGVVDAFWHSGSFLNCNQIDGSVTHTENEQKLRGGTLFPATSLFYILLRVK